MPAQPKTEKIYQFSIINENLEQGKQETPDLVSYNVHHELFNDDYDKNYDDYQSYGDENSDNTMGKADINFINLSTPSQPEHTWDRCHSSFNSRNRLFIHLRLFCWKSNANNKLSHEETIVMVTDATFRWDVIAGDHFFSHGF